jgi:hypothetical protein
MKGGNNVLDDKLFFEKEITPRVARLLDEVNVMIHQKVTVPKIYNYIMLNAQNYKERYIVLMLFGMAYQGYKEDHIYKNREMKL